MNYYISILLDVVTSYILHIRWVDVLIIITASTIIALIFVWDDLQVLQLMVGMEGVRWDPQSNSTHFDLNQILDTPYQYI